MHYKIGVTTYMCIQWTRDILCCNTQLF